MTTTKTEVSPRTIPQQRQPLWTLMPGWGIAADLTPPELINARRLKVLRKMMAAGVVLLLLACVGGYYLAARENTSAADDLAGVQVETMQLQSVARGYSGVIAIQGAVSQVQSHVAKVMDGDVDLVALMVVLESNLPKTMTISQEAITISTAGVAGSTGAAGASGLDNSGLPRIGTISMSGTGQTLNDLSDYVDNLHTVPGLVDVLPLSNTRAGTGRSGTQFSLTIGLTNALLSHRFDVGGR